ncbi:VTT domain-containing protein [uncultured Maritimibacter sp.]|uniref:DedA family protein n=1 Tax=uncultured Maritimibacter sp. TaxID=991866 RepID=UPI0026210CEE|nr:VTT domain-containing protein [uncultured Maritimibacter sp.]
MDSFVSHYGLAAIFIGCLLEGETVAIAGGLLAHRHLLVPWQVVATVAAAVFVSDMGYFLLARRYRSHRRMRGFAERPAFARALRVMGRNPTLLAASFRFVPGMRIVGPVALGQSGFPPVRFALIAGCAGILWSTFYVTAGHAVGVAVHALLGDLARDRWLISVPVALVLGVGAVLLARRMRRVRRGLRPS